MKKSIRMKIVYADEIDRRCTPRTENGYYDFEFDLRQFYCALITYSIILGF
jgi:hypothetical protein